MGDGFEAIRCDATVIAYALSSQEALPKALEDARGEGFTATPYKPELRVIRLGLVEVPVEDYLVDRGDCGLPCGSIPLDVGLES